MNRSLRFCTVCLVALTMASSPTAGFSQVATGGDVVVNMRGVDIREVAEQISRLTGRTLVLDPNVSGLVTVVSAQPLSSAGVWDLFLSVLRTYGFAAVRSGSVWRIVLQATAIQNGASGGDGSSQQVVTRLIRLRNVPGDQAVRALRPLVSSFGNIESTANPNAVVVTDYADNVRRVEAIARSLDTGGGESFANLPLEHASAEDVATALTALLGGEAGGARVASDPRSNTVIVRGGSADIAQARTIVASLDRPGGATPVTRVVRLRNADAEGVVEIVRGLMGGEPSATNPISRSLRQTGLASLSAASRAADATSVLSSGSRSESPAPSSTQSAGESRARGFALNDVTVQPASELNAIVMRGAPATVQMLADLIDELDVRRPQVTIEAAIVEVTGELGERLGVQLALGGAVPADGVTGGSSFTNAGTSLSQILGALGVPGAAGLSEGLTVAAGSEGDFGILLQALSQTSSANLLSTPSVTVLDNQPAEIVVGQNVPFRTGAFATEGNTTNPFTTITREDVGVTLRVVPRVHDGDVVRLEVSQEVSSLVNGNVIGAADLITNRRSIQTTVLADDGQTIALGGLISDDIQTGNTKVPVLGDIPGVGALFRSRRDSQTRRTLFIFLRPTILRDADDVRIRARERYERLRQDGGLDTRARTDGLDTLEPPTTPR